MNVPDTLWWYSAARFIFWWASTFAIIAGIYGLFQLRRKP